MDDLLSQRIRAGVRNVPDFPSRGVMFRDITPLLADPALFRDALTAMAQPFASEGITHVVAVESRGFLFGAPVALALIAAFVPARKPGKLPGPVVRETYALEYGEDTLAVHADAFDRGARVLLVDDVLATGGTAAACCRIIARMGGDLVGVSVLAELVALDGRKRLDGRRVECLVRY